MISVEESYRRVAKKLGKSIEKLTIIEKLQILNVRSRIRDRRDHGIQFEPVDAK